MSKQRMSTEEMRKHERYRWYLVSKQQAGLHSNSRINYIFHKKTREHKKFVSYSKEFFLAIEHFRKF